MGQTIRRYMNIMGKKIEESNGAWYVTETVPLETIIKNLSDNPTFKLETVDARPRISFSIALPQTVDYESIGYNEYRIVKVVCQLSSNDTYWGTKMWILGETQDSSLNDLAAEIAQAETPDVYRISHFNEIVDIARIAKYYGGIAALEKKYGSVYKGALEGGFELKSISRSNDSDKSAPLISVRGTYFEDVYITVKADIFNGSVSIKYKNKNNDKITTMSLPPLWDKTRKSLLGSNSDPNSVANSLRIAMFLDNNKAWSSLELIGELINIIDIDACKVLKNVV
jgi:hypothetical protein